MSDVINPSESNLQIVLDIIQDIPRLVPYSYNNKKRVLKYDEKNGLLEFKNDIKYLLEEYNEILKKKV